MRIRRRLPLILTVLAVAAAIIIAVILRKHAPPEPARLLPGADGYVYIDLRWLRRANLLGELPPVPRAPEYEHFIQATGFQFERDLDQAAFAIHYPPQQASRNAPPQPRFSEVMVGKINGEKVRDYLRQISTSIDQYGSTEIFNIPLEGRVLRVAILGVDTVAASNFPDPQVIRGIIDRSRKLASPFGGPAMLRQYYKDVPLTSLIWAIFQAGSIPANAASRTGPFDWSFLFQRPAVVVLSVRYLGSILFKADAYTSDDEQAQQIAERLGTFLNLFRTAEASVPAGASDEDVKKFLDSLKVAQSGKQAIVSATVPVNLIHKIFTEVPNQVTSPPIPAKPAAPATSHVRRKTPKTPAAHR